MSDANKRDARETIARLQRYLEDLDVSKESALLIQDDLNNRAANQSNRTMYMLIHCGSDFPAARIYHRASGHQCRRYAGR